MPRRPLDTELSRIAAKRARAAAEVAEFDRQLAVLQRAQAELFDVVVEEHRNEVLHKSTQPSKIINTMDAETSMTRGARLGTKHPGAVAIRRVDGSVARFAAKNRLHATTVRSWYAKGEAAREIPKKWADALAEKPYEVPLTAWRNGIGE